MQGRQAPNCHEIQRRPLCFPLCPMRRLQREVDACQQAVLRLALLRPHVTFTLYDRRRKAFLLRMLKVIKQLPSLGNPPLKGGACCLLGLLGYNAQPAFHLSRFSMVC